MSIDWSTARSVAAGVIIAGVLLAVVGMIVR